MLENRVGAEFNLGVTMDDLIKQVFSASNVFVTAKDNAGRYLYCNEKVAEAVGLDSSHQIVGKTDYELCWRNQAELYIAGDQRVMAGSSYVNVVEPQTQVNGNKKILISKSVILNAGAKCVGTAASYVDISNYFVRKKTFYLQPPKGNRFYLGGIFGNEYLTRKEMKVLKMVLLGMGSKQIAKYLPISPRTAEMHISKLKSKLQCSTVGDIVIMAMKTGLTFAALDSDNWEEGI